MKAAFYLRLSVADGDALRGDESNSIANQRLLLQNYLYSAALSDAEVTEYIDDGYSGSNFRRPAFQQMLEDAKRGRIDMILVKDLSRLGRDYIGVGDYLEQVFPTLGIRFVAVNAHYDSSEHPERTIGLELSIGNLINTLYCRDISQKLKSALRTRWKQGISTCSRLPFGYVKNAERKWVIDPEAAGYVRMIFDLALDGHSTRRIVEHLNAQHIPTPGKYRMERTGSGVWNRIVPDTEWIWDAEKVWRTLKNYAYTGAMVQGKTTTLRVGTRQRRTLPREQQFIVEGVYQGIVTQTEFEKAQQVMHRRTAPALRKDAGYLLTGKLRCGNCRLRMIYQKGAEPMICCRHKLSGGSHSSCSDARYSAKELEQQVWLALREHLNAVVYVADCTLSTEGRSGLREEKRRLQQLIEEKTEERIWFYTFYAERGMEKAAYLRQKAALSEEIRVLKERLSLCSDEAAAEDSHYATLARLRSDAQQAIQCGHLTRQAVTTFLDTVYVSSNGQLTIHFRHDSILNHTKA